MADEFDVRAWNRAAWNRQVAAGNRWTVPVSAEQVARARRGEWEVLLTPTRPVPRAWFGELAGARVLGLASAGGQQGPILAAAGADVTLLDNAPAQLGRDRDVAAREGLALRCVEGDMRDLSAFEDASFDLVFHPVSNCFVPDILPVWREAHRVLRPGGALLAGFTNPVFYLFDEAALQRGDLQVRHAIPYSDLTHLTAEERERAWADGEPLNFGHTLEDQLGGQCRAGLHITDLYEDVWDEALVIDRFIPCFMATRAVRPR